MSNFMVVATWDVRPTGPRAVFHPDEKRDAMRFQFLQLAPKLALSLA
jgi:hypothetical protein